MAITNNDTPKSVPSAHNNVLKSPDNSTEEQIAQNEGGFPAWAILLIVAVCIILLISLGVVAYFATKRIRDRRKNHGEYKPQQVEHMQAKDLPYITPPNIEGLPTTTKY